MQQYCIYLRKSRVDLEAEANGEMETLARHEKILLEQAKKMNISVTKIYREVVSGETITARPMVQQLLNEVEQGIWTGVLVVEVERLARGDSIDQGIVARAFKTKNTKIITPLKTYDPNNEFDEEYFEFGLFMSRREYKTINRRLQRGRVASVKEGKYVASIAPYGYERVKVKNDKGFTLAIVPEQAEIIKLIFSLYVNGFVDENGNRRHFGIQQIARRLNEMRVPPIRHDYWQKETIRDILINPVYIGKVRWKWRSANKIIENGITSTERPRNYNEDCIIADGLHKAIIDKETFELAQEIISRTPPNPVGCKKELQNPFAGIIVCGRCGRHMVMRKSYKKPDYIVCHTRECDNVSAPFNDIERNIISALKLWLINYKLILEKQNDTHIPESEVIDKSLKKIENEVSVLEKQQSHIHDLLEQGIYTAKMFTERSRIIKDKINTAENDYLHIRKELYQSIIREEKKQDILPKIEYLLDVYEQISSVSYKNELLKEILDKIVYTKTVNACFRGQSADDFELVLYPKLPKMSL